MKASLNTQDESLSYYPSATSPDGDQHQHPTAVSRLARGLTLLMARTSTNTYSKLIRRGSMGLMSLLRLHLKIKGFEDLTEAETLRYVATHTSIPVPKVHCAFCHRGRTFIVMQKTKGHMAARKWHDRTDASKTKVLEQLRQMVDELRSVAPPPLHRVENVVHGPIYDCRLPSELFWGPFNSVQAFHEALIGLDNLHDDCTGLPRDMAELMGFLRGTPVVPVLTHGDLSSLNIMVKGDRVVGIVDWETAGWLPSYWESVSAWNVNPQNYFWQDEVSKFITIDPKVIEMDRIRRQYFGAF